MTNNLIYDREEVCDKILEVLDYSNETSVFMVYAYAGVGKSAVSKKIKNILNDDSKKMICVVLPQDNKNIQEGAFIRAIFKYTRKYFDKNVQNGNLKEKFRFGKYTFAYFLRKQEKYSSIIQCLHDNMDIVDGFVSAENKPNVYTSSMRFFLSYLLIKIGVSKSLIDNISNNYRLMCNYLKYVLDQEDIIINIDNIQNFDNLSLNFFLELLMDTKEHKNFFLLEFTLLLDNSNYETLENLKREFKNAEISVTDFKLENLDMKNVLKLARNNCKTYDKMFDSVVKYHFKKLYNGNLKKIEYLANMYSKDASYGTNPIYEKMKALSSSQKYILAIIIINNSIINQNTLKYIINNSNVDFIIDYEKDVINFCNDSEFICQEHDEICIVHSSFVDTWYENINVFKVYELNAYNNCHKIYRRILNNKLFHSISKQECLLLLFQLYGKFEISRLSEVLLYIDDIIYDFLSVDELYNYLHKLIDAIECSDNAIDFLYKITDICIKFQMYDLEAYCLKKIQSIIGNEFNEKYCFYQYTRLFQGEEYEALLELIKSNYEYKLSETFRTYSILFEIVANRALNNIEHYHKLVDDLTSSKIFNNTVQQAYFFRLAEAYEERDLAIPKVEKSIELFNKANLPLQSAKAQVSLAFLYAITGNIAKAKKELSSSEDLLLNNIANKYIFNINKACIYLLSGNFGNHIWLLLDEAEKCVRMKADKIAVIINKIIWCIENHDYNKGTYLQNKGMELLDTECDKHLHAIFYYNCYVLNKSMNNLEKQTYFYNLAVANKRFCKTLTARLNGEDVVSDNTTFLLSKPWHVCFVSFWYIDYLNDLE